MCNRVSAPEFREIKIRWNLFNDLPEFKRSYNIAPGRGDIVTIVQSDAGNEGHFMYWPLIPSVAKEMRLEYSTTNATAERLTESRIYNRLIDRRRCLIPVTGFYEWQGSRSPKTPFYVYLRSNETFGLGALWDTWKKPDGSVLESFAIITTEPNELIRPIHRRMPLIIHRDDEQKWLNCAANDFNRVRSLVKPFPAELMAAHEVSKRVNNSKYDAPDCADPVEPEQGSLFG